MATQKRSTKKPNRAKDTGTAVSPQEQNDRKMIVLLESIDRKLQRGERDEPAREHYVHNIESPLNPPEQNPPALEELVQDILARTERMRIDVSGLAARILHGPALENSGAGMTARDAEKRSYGPGKNAALDALHNLTVINDEIGAIARYVINS